MTSTTKQTIIDNTADSAWETLETLKGQIGRIYKLQMAEVNPELADALKVISQHLESL